MGAGKTTVGRLARRAPRPAVASTPTQMIEARTGPHGARDLRRRRRAGVPRARDRGAASRRSAEPEPLVIAAAGGVVLRRGEPRGAAATPTPRSCGCAPTRPCSSSGSTRGDAPAAARRRPAGTLRAHAARRASRCTARSPTSSSTSTAASADDGRRRGSSSGGRPGCARVTVPLGDRALRRPRRPRRALASSPALLPPTARRAASSPQAGDPARRRRPGITAERLEIGHGERHKTLATVEDAVPRASPASG